MKICVLGLDGAAPEVILHDERLVNLRRLMDLGLYGRLQSVTTTFALWDQLAREGRKSIVVGVSGKDEFTDPASIKAEIEQLVGDDPVDIKNLHTDRKDRLRDEIFAMSRRQWQVVRHLLTDHEWDYFHFMDIGLDPIQRSFWNHFDKSSAHYKHGNPYENVVPDYYLWLDEQVGSVMDLLDEQTVLLVVSESGVQLDDGPNVCDDAPDGMFLLAAPNCPLSGEYEGARLLDIAPTLLDLAGYDIPDSMQGRSLVAGLEKKSAGDGFGSGDNEQLIHDRLAGLGYI
jgi:predicted AlkP superfamily phosphohydrolase/phosphomutase